MSLVLDTASLDELRLRIGQLGEERIEPLLDRIGEELEEETRRRILTIKHSPDGAPWAPRKRSAGHALLERSGRLAGSILHQTIPEGVEVGSPLIYAAAQMFGSSKRGIRGRAFLGISPEEVPELERAAAEFLLEAI